MVNKIINLSAMNANHINKQHNAIYCLSKCIEIYCLSIMLTTCTIRADSAAGNNNDVFVDVSSLYAVGAIFLNTNTCYANQCFFASSALDIDFGRVLSIGSSLLYDNRMNEVCLNVSSRIYPMKFGVGLTMSKVYPPQSVNKKNSVASDAYFFSRNYSRLTYQLIDDKHMGIHAIINSKINRFEINYSVKMSSSISFLVDLIDGNDAGEYSIFMPDYYWHSSWIIHVLLKSRRILIGYYSERLFVNLNGIAEYVVESTVFSPYYSIYFLAHEKRSGGILGVDIFKRRKINLTGYLILGKPLGAGLSVAQNKNKQ